MRRYRRKMGLGMTTGYRSPAHFSEKQRAVIYVFKLAHIVSNIRDEN